MHWDRKQHLSLCVYVCVCVLQFLGVWMHMFVHLASAHHVHLFVLCVLMFTALFPSITHVQLASKLPSSCIMDQGMFSLLILDHLSKQASNSPACPGNCPSKRNGDLNDMDGELRQRQAAQILISGAAFELVSLSQSVTRGTLWWVEKATQQTEKEFAGLSDCIHI